MSESDTQLVAVSVLNGEITVGDTVAVAVGEGRSGGGMRMGTVIGFKGALPRVRVGVRIEKSSGYTGHHWYFDDEGHYVSTYKPYEKWYDQPERIVKVA